MKKLFFSSSASSDLQNSFVGKSYRVGRYSCTVEDVIAEGKIETSLVFLTQSVTEGLMLY
jgi:hypothetical protein